jgi:Domain of unknown function (DUF1707)
MTGEIAPAGEGREPAAGRELRASYEDRDRVAEELRVAAGDGRLTADELDQRLEAALTARTYGELAALTADLPGVAGARPDVPVARPQRAGRIEVGSASVRREGQWEVPQELDVRIGSGTVVLDFTRTSVPHSRLEIDAEIRSGSLKIVTRPGVAVDAAGVSIRSGSVKVRSWPGAQPPASLVIHITGSVTSGSVVARPPRRTFWQWLTRRPQQITGG